MTSTKSCQFSDPFPFHPQKRTIDILFHNNKIHEHLKNVCPLLPLCLDIINICPRMWKRIAYFLQLFTGVLVHLHLWLSLKSMVDLVKSDHYWRVPMLALTATATSDIIKFVSKSLCLSSPVMVTQVRDRDNIKFFKITVLAYGF